MLNKIENTCENRDGFYVSFLYIGVRNKVLTKNYSSFQLIKIQSFRFFQTKVSSHLRIGPHNKDVLSVIIGSLLGDCYANSRTIDGVRFCFRQSIVHKDYLFWLYSFFLSNGYCSNLEPRKYTRTLKNKPYYGYEFNTYTFNSLK